MRLASTSGLSALLAILTMCSGCSPKIYTEITKSLPSRIEGSTVLVYNIADSVPPEAEELGGIRVKDTGFSTGCDFPTVMQIAKEQTNKIGGNALHLLRHKKPSAMSTCHQIVATMLTIPDSLYTATYFDNLAAQQSTMATEGYPMVTNSNATTFLSPQTRSSSSPRYQADDLALQKKGESVLSVRVGYSTIISKFYNPLQITGNLKSGLEISTAYQWTAPSKLGFGLRYTGYFAWGQLEGRPYNYTIHYAAPEFVTHQSIGRNWIFRQSMGLGYARIVESVENISGGMSGFGLHGILGLEYRLSKYVGLGIGASYYLLRFSKMDEYLGEGEAGGISRLSVNGGFNIYF